MGTPLMVVGLLLCIAVIGLVVYLVREATVLKTSAQALHTELRQFKEGGFDRLINEKLGVIAQKASQEIEQRERLLQEHRAQALEEERKATEAIRKFSTDLGAVAAQIANLRELQAEVGELNNLLKPQQLRGELGEVIVRSLITDKLPHDQYEENHTFPDGKQVEFAIRLNDRLIPVDSKLPLDDYKRMRESVDERQRQTCRTEFKRTVKKKIDEVKEYIRPEEGTYNFALMVIPSEAVYYDLVANKDFSEENGLSEYAKARNVFLTSPSTFWAYVTAIAHGLRGLEIERHAEQILASLQTLAVKIHHFSQDEFRKVGAHLKDAANKYEDAERKLREIDDSLTALERVETHLLTQQGVTR